MSKNFNFLSREQALELCRRYPFGSQRGRGLETIVICKFDRPGTNFAVYVTEMREKPNSQIECFGLVSYGDPWLEYQYFELSGVKRLCEGSEGLKYYPDFKPVALPFVDGVKNAEDSTPTLIGNTMARWNTGKADEARARREKEEAEYNNQEGLQLQSKASRETSQPAEPINTKEILTIEEAARYLGIAKSTLYRLTMTRAIPHYKPFGKQCYFNRVELVNWIQSNRVSTADEIGDRAAAYCMKKGGQV